MTSLQIRSSLDVFVINLVSSHRAIFRYARIVILLTGCLISGKTVIDSVAALTPELVYRKDFLQEYVMGKAIQDGTNPYLHLPELLSKYGLYPETRYFPHPTPHTLTAAALAYPLSFLDFPTAALCWTIFELVVFSLAIFVIAEQWLKPISTIGKFSLVLLLLGVKPVYSSFVLGQLSTLMLLFAAILTRPSARRSDITAGVGLGAMLAVKYFGWPLLLFFLLRRRWRVAGIAICILVASLLFSTAIVGVGGLRGYFADVVPEVVNGYAGDEFNHSIVMFGQMLFGGFYPGVQQVVTTSPLFPLPEGIPIARAVFGLAFFGWAMTLALRVREEGTALSLLLIASTLVSPLAWMHCFTVSLPAFAIIAQKLRSRTFPPGYYFGAFLLFVSYYLGTTFRDIAIGQRDHVGFILSLVILVPIVTHLALIKLLAMFDAKGSSSQTTVSSGP